MTRVMEQCLLKNALDLLKQDMIADMSISPQVISDRLREVDDLYEMLAIKLGEAR